MSTHSTRKRSFPKTIILSGSSREKGRILPSSQKTRKQPKCHKLNKRCSNRTSRNINYGILIINSTDTLTPKLPADKSPTWQNRTAKKDHLSGSPCPSVLKQMNMVEVLNRGKAVQFSMNFAKSPTKPKNNVNLRPKCFCSNSGKNSANASLQSTCHANKAKKAFLSRLKTRQSLWRLLLEK